MFEPNFNQSLFLLCLQQQLLKGNLFIAPEPMPRRVNAVRIPGGLTPP
ncbi:hypothetical protein IFO70_19800 [Phormidium tenue FACHB-886]|nr:hypothetical protein [Phormidium tenue FACHB-886]